MIALDAAWGQGKSTFIKMWRGHLLNESFHSIYFDAFENDYQTDPFLAISSEIYTLIEDKNKKEEYKEKAVRALKVISKTALRVGITSATAGLVNLPAGSGKDITDAASDAYDDYLKEKISNAKAEKQSIASFKAYLEELSQTLGHGKKLIFIIDELDRCKPRFALAIIESIKHLFSTKNLCFLLVVNRKQLEESVRHEYGALIDSASYLTKFITLWNTLPKNFKDEFDTLKYLVKCAASMNFSFDKFSDDLILLFRDMNEHYDLSFRDVERALTNFSLLINTHKSAQGYQSELIYLLYWILSVVKLKDVNEYSKIISKDINFIRNYSKLKDLPNREVNREDVNMSLEIISFFSLEDKHIYSSKTSINSHLVHSVDWYRKNIGLSGFGRVLDSISID